MELRDDSGLSVAVASAGEALALSRDRRALPPGVNVLRVPDPPAGSWVELARAGFVRKPSWITWVSPVCDTDEEWLARLPKRSRYDVRRARQAAARELRQVVRQPLEPAGLEEFLLLYGSMVARMPHGVGFAASLREAILAEERHYAVYAYGADGMAGGCLCLESPQTGTVKLRFSAVDPLWRDRSLARVLYAEAVAVARRKGYRRVTLGNDPNLYGHIPQPGLLTFKARLGFTPVAAEPFGMNPWRDEADLLLSLDGLNDLVLMLGYLGDVWAGDGFPGYRLEARSRRPVDPGRCDFPFVLGARHRLLPD
ncbi:GNAT family N-acetyltransferase [Streptosporangium canum]|uniref:Acetyltransferase (GNAT) domain-containing protein n=1 Tax=Streptosporangium canum TaxID=324952 RepID=A0A1I3NI18_9ACTN|nr:GNAT family N-acetyltransferase [Streptosporangium canum]SFJ08812.1 Acetyltransferase (GNAT) domain-containing protein [Streptosporangium canum]